MAGQDPFDPLGPERDAAAARLDVTALTDFLAGGADNVSDGVGAQLVEHQQSFGCWSLVPIHRLPVVSCSVSIAQNLPNTVVPTRKQCK
jgi:hypothetical protein